jgi:hypothetical protein
MRVSAVTRISKRDAAAEAILREARGKYDLIVMGRAPARATICSSAIPPS